MTKVYILESPQKGGDKNCELQCKIKAETTF